MYKFLDKIDSPSDLRKLNKTDLVTVADECRQFLITTMSQTSGHFASSLGVVELTVALHYVYNTPDDKIVWDVGHQAYIHKILTGRKHLFPSLRKFNGLSGFPKRDESNFDTFGVGHASTSISAGYGMVCAAEQLNKNTHVVSVIGDGSLTGGLAFEGLNNAGAHKKNYVVILNDNDMSIDENVGAFNKYITKIVTSRRFNKVKDDIWNWTERHKDLGKYIQKIGHKLEQGVITGITPGALFEQLGFTYVGPVDGHDLPTLIEILEKVRLMHGPILLHLMTTKGKGYSFAEQDSLKYHAVSSPFNPDEGMNKKADSTKVQYTKIFGDAIEELAQKDDKIMVITPAMISGSGLKNFANKFPNQLYDVGIAEGHSITFAAGMATENLKVVASIYSSFLQRAFDNVIHDVAIQKLHVVFCIDRAGVVGPDGSTHHGCYDLSYMRCVPNMTIMVPGSAQELRDMLYTAIYHFNGPIALRYARDGELITDPLKTFNKIEIGKGLNIVIGEKIALLAIGTMVKESKLVLEELKKESINASLYNMRFVKPLDTEMLDNIAKSYTHIVTLEEGSLPGGFGSAVAEYFSDKNISIKMLRIGIPDRFVEHGSREELFVDMGLDYQSIFKTIKQFYI